MPQFLSLIGLIGNDVQMQSSQPNSILWNTTEPVCLMIWTSDLWPIVSCPGNECEPRVQHSGEGHLSQPVRYPGHSVLVLESTAKILPKNLFDLEEATSSWEISFAAERFWVRYLLAGNF